MIGGNSHNPQIQPPESGNAPAMKKNLFGPITLATLLATPLVSLADTIFSDDFSISQVNAAPAPPTATSTRYQFFSGLAGGTAAISANDLSLRLPNSTSVLGEAQALFAATPWALNVVGDYIEFTLVFRNTANMMVPGNNNCSLTVGLFNSGGAAPNQGVVTLNAGNTTGGSQNWVGYAGGILLSSSSNRLITRPAQTANGTTSQNQDLLFNGASSSQSFNSPGGTEIVHKSDSAAPVTLTQGSTYTLDFSVTMVAPGSLQVSNALYSGSSVNAANTIFNEIGTASGATLVATAFDGLAFGWRESLTSAAAGTNDVVSILVTGQSTPVSTPPTISSEPAPVSVPVGGSAMFSVGASGVNLSYQWHRHGTNLLNGGDISGATSSTLIIGPVALADFVSDYYVTVTGAGDFATNSVNVALSSRTALNLVWNDSSGAGWDLATTADWLNGASPAVFNYGDNVTFDDTALANNVVLNYSYLSPGSVTVNSQYPYKFQGSGSIAGLGSLVYEGSGRLTINATNSYSGGTLISNASAYLYLGSPAGLGNGPVVFGQVGGQMEIPTAGGPASGINGDVVVADDFSIKFDGSGSYAGVFFGNLSGTAGKTLTFNASATTNYSRIRLYGTNTVCNANLVLNGVDAGGGSAVYVGTVLAPYNGSGSQTYNGIISGVGGLIQRASGTTILNGANTYSGGTTPSTGAIAFGTNTAGAVTSGPIGTGPLFLAPELPNTTGSGTVLAWGGARTIANPIQYPSATNNQTLIIGGTNALTFTGPITLNGNDNTGNNTNRIFQVTNTALTTFSGVISDAAPGFGLTKTGSGVLALNNTETYTGPTTVSNGTLQVNGQLGSGAVTVATNAVLGGNGTIAGPVSVLPGGTLAPGASIGLLTINNNLSIAGNLMVEVDRSALRSSDQVMVIGTLTNTGNGTVTVTNLGPALTQGDTFNLFNSKALANGGTLTITGGGVVWNNKLAINGTIEVQSLIAATPTNISYSVSGTNLTLSWPPNYLTWTLQSNAVSVVAATNWYAVPNSGNVTSIVIPIYPSRTNLFYRLLRP